MTTTEEVCMLIAIQQVLNWYDKEKKKALKMNDAYLRKRKLIFLEESLRRRINKIEK